MFNESGQSLLMSKALQNHAALDNKKQRSRAERATTGIDWVQDRVCVLELVNWKPVGRIFW